jgi:Kef-type K+ transport system membrane component KefB/mannitol/fructose-specific phosphotransferase system IIA component (Ntr-type)
MPNRIEKFIDGLNLPITDPVLIFAVVMIIILVVPIVFKRMRIPDIVGLILAGTVVGPSVLGLLDRDDTIILLGTVGLLYLMFMAGLSIDLNKFEKMKDRSIVFGLFSFFVPQISAIFVGIYLLDFDLFPSLLLGSIVGSHTLLAYPIAERIGIAKNSAVTMTMGGTIVTDTLSLLVLAIVSGAVTGDIGLHFWVTFSGMVVVYTFAVFWGLPRLGRWFFKDARNETNIEYVFLVALLFITAYLADFVGLAPIIGAFLAGLALNRLVPGSSPLMSRVQFVGNVFFIPFFLISVGMLVDVKVLAESLDIWIIAGAFTGLVLVGKFIPAKIVQWIYSYTREEGITIYGLSTAQAAATLAVTLVGYEIGLFNSDVVNAVVIMMLITCLVGPWITEKFGKVVALQEEKKPYQPSEAPQRILVPLANPSTSEALMDLALLIRDKKSEEPVFPLTVARESADVEAQVASSEKMLSHAVIHAASADIPVLPVTRVDMNIANGILRAAKELRISDIVIGWNGEVSAKRRIFGGILDRVLEQSKQLIIVSHIAHSVNTAERVILVIPDYAEREPGFSDAIRNIKNIINELGASLVIFTTEKSHTVIEEVISKTEPELEAEIFDITSWLEVIGTKIDIDENDLFIILSAREGTISWDNQLERIPGILAQRYSENNFLIIYPSEQEVSELPGLKIHFEGSANLPSIDAEDITFDLNRLTAEKAIEKILNPHFGDKPDILENMVQTVIKLDPDNLPGEIPGVALTKIRSSLVSEVKLLMGISKSGIDYPGFEKPVHVIFLLISPRSISMERNLRLLAKLAGLIKSSDTVNHLKEAKTIKEIREIFN